MVREDEEVAFLGATLLTEKGVSPTERMQGGQGARESSYRS